MDNARTVSAYILGKSRLRSAWQIVKYMGCWFAYFLRSSSHEPGDRFYDDMAKPFATWLEERGLHALVRLSRRSTTAMGYGFVEEFPALYGLRWNTPLLVITGVLNLTKESIAGWKRLWEAIAWTLDVRYQVEVKRVTRGDGGFRVEARTPAGSEVFEFDHLVITTPLDESLAWLDADEDEARVADGIRWTKYASTPCICEGWFQDENTVAYRRYLEPGPPDEPSRGHLIMVRRTRDKTPVRRARAARRADVYMCYQYAEIPGWRDLSEEDLRRELRERLVADVAADGGELVEVLDQEMWKYSPQITAGEIGRGLPQLMRDLQGRRNTWYSGASYSLEAVDSIVDFNVTLYDRLEYVLGDLARRPWPVRAWWRLRSRWHQLSPRRW